MTTDNLIAKHLKEYHRGELRVVPSRELEAAFQIRGPDLRRTINCLRGDGIPICSSDDAFLLRARRVINNCPLALNSQLENARCKSCLLYTSFLMLCGWKKIWLKIR